ncbi:hypothetical protein AJ79_03288 [Helicocarpus griseus UAMH5409]|uniref:Glucose-methanol-choline oxidoreductase N-terminal domain-containing protein n=1 Tax=Helicocarpus griseus UAMH5409 TaxID=1447875 RepID=A0A2B7XYL7_9EURO|nr:hypothetical protein AJ79_03288 [Helicocarpus griseus UAMH5409]
MYPFFAQFVFPIALIAVLTLTSAKPVAFRHANVLSRAGDIKEAYDYVVVGAGTSGLTVADRLTEDGKHTVLVIEYCHLISDEVIEAGGGRFFADPGIYYNITSTPQPELNNRTQGVILGCCVGGSSAVNGMVFVRGTKTEYDGWAELGGPDSTWDWDGVLPYFRKASHFTHPEETLAEAFNITWNPDSWGQDPDTHLYATFPTFQNTAIIPMYEAMKKMPGIEIPIDGASGDNGLFWHPASIDPEKFWRSYARTAHYDNISRENFEVLTRHKVRRVLFDGTTATGVEFVPRDGDDTTPLSVKANKEVILSAGAIHTPQILQKSGIGPKSLLEQADIPVVVDIPGVGQNFQDHLYLYVGYELPSPEPRRLTSILVTNGTPPAPNVTLPGDPSTITGPNIGAWIGLPVVTENYEDIASRYAAQDPAAYLPADTHPSVLAGYEAFQSLHADFLRSKNVNMLWIVVGGLNGAVVMNMHIVSHGTVNINTTDIEAEPVVDYRALSNPIDLELMVENILFYRRYMMESEDFKPYGPNETSPGLEVEGEALEEWIRETLIPTNYHPVGTAGKKPLEMGGVVDEELLLHGVERLRVVDASVMPLLPGANTQQPCYMIAEKVG